MARSCKFHASILDEMAFKRPLEVLVTATEALILADGKLTAAHPILEGAVGAASPRATAACHRRATHDVAPGWCRTSIACCLTQYGDPKIAGHLQDYRPPACRSGLPL